MVISVINRACRKIPVFMIKYLCLRLALIKIQYYQTQNLKPILQTKSL